MSEINTTPEDLVEEIELEIDDANVIPIPIDPTLTHPGEAADAKATGDAIRRMGANININGVVADMDGTFHVYPADIPMSDAQGAQNVGQVLEDIGGRTGEDILINSESSETIDETISGITTGIAEQIASVRSSISSVDSKVDDYISDNDAAVADLQDQIDEEFTDEQVHQFVLDVFEEGGE